MQSNKKVLITGAGGYIGRHVVKEFLERGYEVVANDLKFDDIDTRAELSNVMIFDEAEELYEKLGSPDILVHLAWKNGFVHNSETHMLDLSSHFNFLKKMMDSGVKMLSVMGSMHEVGYWEGKITEETPCNPLSMYGIAKNSLRQAIFQYGKNKNITIHWLRGFYICGDDERGSSIFAKLLQAEKEQKEEFPFTSGKNKYDFIDLNVLAKQIVAATLDKNYPGIINVCSGVPVSLAEKVEAFIKSNKLKIRLKYGAFPDREYDSPEIWGDATVINKIMGNIDETIQ